MIGDEAARLRNLADFDFMVEKITANYSGFPTKVTSSNRDTLAQLTSRLREQAACSTEEDIEGVLREWVAFFRDGHIGVYPNPRAEASSETSGEPKVSPGASARSEDEVPVDGLFLRMLSRKSLCLRIPDFGSSRYEILRKLLADHAPELQAIDNLVIDIRDNGGGSDLVFAPLVPLLYTQPIYSIGNELRATEDNVAAWRKQAEQSGLPVEIRDALRAGADRMEAHLGEFVSAGERQFSVWRFDSVLPCPRRVAILVDGTASSGEQFLLVARQSRKVTLFGKRNSQGVLDFANCVYVPSPSGRFLVKWAISRSLRLPDDPVDPDGIAPDIRIPEDAEDPIAYAQAWLERQVD